MSGDNPPDVMMQRGLGHQRRPLAGRPDPRLDPYAEQFGWFEEFPSRASWSTGSADDARRWARAPRRRRRRCSTSAPSTTEKLARSVVTDVSTIDTKNAFLAILDQAKAAGEIPVMLGTSDKWRASTTSRCSTAGTSIPTSSKTGFQRPGSTL
jgi:hypothetical protein